MLVDGRGGESSFGGIVCSKILKIILDDFMICILIVESFLHQVKYSFRNPYKFIQSIIVFLIK